MNLARLPGIYWAVGQSIRVSVAVVGREAGGQRKDQRRATLTRKASHEGKSGVRPGCEHVCRGREWPLDLHLQFRIARWRRRRAVTPLRPRCLTRLFSLFTWQRNGDVYTRAGESPRSREMLQKKDWESARRDGTNQPVPSSYRR